MVSNSGAPLLPNKAYILSHSGSCESFVNYNFYLIFPHTLISLQLYCKYKTMQERNINAYEDIIEDIN